MLHDIVSNKAGAVEAAASFHCELHHKQHLSKHIQCFIAKKERLIKSGIAKV